MLSKRSILLSTVIFISTSHADMLYNHYVGQYVSLNAGVTYANKIFDSGVTKSGILGAGGNLFLGDQINPYFAPELDIGYFSFGSRGGVTMFSLGGRFTYSVGSGVSLFAKLAPAYAEVITRLTTRVQKNTFLPALGLGVGIGFTPQTMMTIEANGVWLPEDLGNANGVMGGLTLGVTHYWNM